MPEVTGIPSPASLPCLYYIPVASVKTADISFACIFRDRT